MTVTAPKTFTNYRATTVSPLQNKEADNETSKGKKPKPKLPSVLKKKPSKEARTRISIGFKEVPENRHNAKLWCQLMTINQENNILKQYPFKLKRC